MFSAGLPGLKVHRLPALAPSVLLFSLEPVRDQAGAAGRHTCAPEATSAVSGAHPRPSRCRCSLPAAVGPGAWTHAGSPCPCLSPAPRFCPNELPPCDPRFLASGPGRPGARTRVGRRMPRPAAPRERRLSRRCAPDCPISSRLPLNSPKAKQITVMASPQVGHAVCS